MPALPEDGAGMLNMEQRLRSLESAQKHDVTSYRSELLGKGFMPIDRAATRSRELMRFSELP